MIQVHVPVGPFCSSFPGNSAGKESTCNAGEPGSILGQEFPWRRDRLPTPIFLGFPSGSVSKESACNVGSLGWEDCLEEEGMAIHSSILAWRIPWTEESGGLQSMGLQGVSMTGLLSMAQKPIMKFQDLWT